MNFVSDIDPFTLGIASVIVSDCALSLQAPMDDDSATLANYPSDPETYAQLARNPSPHFYNKLKTAIQQSSRAWLQRSVLCFILTGLDVKPAPESGRCE